MENSTSVQEIFYIQESPVELFTEEDVLIKEDKKEYHKFLVNKKTNVDKNK